MCKQESSGSCIGCAIIHVGAGFGVAENIHPVQIRKKILNLCPKGRTPQVRAVRLEMQRQQKALRTLPRAAS